MAKLNPPIVEKTLPAFVGNTNIKIPYGLNRAVSASNFNKMHIKIKTVSTNLEVYNGFSKNSNIATEGYAQFDFSGFSPVIGQYYKIQLAFCDKNANNEVGYYSDVGVMKCTGSPTLSISGLGTAGANLSKQSYTGLYSNANDINEKVYSYYFNIYEGSVLYETSGVLLHNSSSDTTLGQSQDTWAPTKGLKAGVEYFIEYGITTLNLYTAVSVKYKIQDKNLITPPSWFDGKLHATPCPEEGYIHLTLHGSKLSGNFLLNRSSSKDNFETWQTITKFSIAKAFDGTTIWKDFTVEQGVEYLYSIQMCNNNDIRTIHMYPVEYKVVCDFEDMFLSDGKRQLKIRFNPKVSSFKTTKLESKVDTIGSKYPFFFRNGNVEYKEFPISGLISVLSDENALFTLQEQNKQARERTPSEFNAPQYAGRVQLTAENVSAERAFKLEVLNWLNNGECKFFRSPGEGNYIVRLLNVSLSPNDTLGRMIHTFNCQAYEIMDCTFGNLRAQGYVGIAENVNYDIQYVKTPLNLADYDFNRITITNKSVAERNNLTMRDIVISNMKPYGTVRSNIGTHTADFNGTCRIGSATSLEFQDNVSMSLATLEFKVQENKHNDWNTFSAYKSVTLQQGNARNSLYSQAWRSPYVDNTTNTCDYLKYLTAIENAQIGEVAYLYIYKRQLQPGDVATTNYIVNIENYEHHVDFKYVSGGQVYQNLGTLSKLECGRGLDIDIVYTKKIVSA